MHTFRELQVYSSDPRLKELLGKSVIVGLWQYYDGELINQSQEYGRIISINQGIQIQTLNGKTLNYPVSYQAIIPAPRGKYKIETTSQEIINPDLLLSWRLDILDPIDESIWQANTAPHIHSIVEKEWDYEADYDQEYNKLLMETRGQELIGKSILIGVRYNKTENGVRRFDYQTQMFGIVMDVSYEKGINVRLKEGAIFTLPPDIAMIQRAPLGEYELQSTGEVVINPDFITLWRITSQE